MKNKKMKKIAALALVIAVSVPALASAYTVQQFFGNYSLGGLKTAEMNFEVTDKALASQNNNVTVTNLVHDAGGSTCHFCKLDIVGKKKGWVFYSKVGSNTINTPTTGNYNGSNYGNVGTGKFKYEITNNGAFQNDGTFRVNAEG